MPKRRKEESEGEETSSSSSSKKKTTAADDLIDAAWSDGGDYYSTTVPELPSNNVDNNNNNNNNNIHGEGRGGGGGNPEDLTGSKVSSAIPIFLKKTYRMIDTCDPEICSWTADGEMFVVKNPDLFASDIIPQYFDHNKFSSFARQLNFYGFRKIQTKPIRNNDYDQSTAKHVTFYNDKFKRDRYDLLKEIIRSTRGGGVGGGGGAGGNNMIAQASLVDQARELENLHSTVAMLGQQVRDLEMRMQTTFMKMDQEIQAKVEYAVMNLLASSSSGATLRNHHHPVHPSQYLGGVGIPSLPTFGKATFSGTYQNPNLSFGDVQSFGNLVRGWEMNPLVGAHVARELGSPEKASEGGGGGSRNGGSSASTGSVSAGSAPTLPPHPKQKSLPPPPLMSGVGGGSIGLHNLSTAGGEISGGMQHTPSSVSADILRNAWEDKLFSTLMMTDGTADTRAASLAGLAAASNAAGMGMLHQGSGGVVGAADMSGLVALAAAQQQQMQQHHVAMGQQAAQAQQQQLATTQAAVAAALMQHGASSFGINIGNAGGGSEPRLTRQSTSEILLEALGATERTTDRSSRSKSGGGRKDDMGTDVSNSDGGGGDALVQAV